ncbi:DUF2147 domain-containing protein [Aureimonas leprariae]|uniref:DUF2147 domain-containing protein n=2 Tax=Plantimonas leprariae TaxID=2615207 RepID=A0A7V7PPU9_9HYPH|nr:DUF2147 domain-containing protein [Aureimonas leprariae]
MAAMLLVLTTAAGSASGAERIVGNWHTPSGHVARIEACGAAFCIFATAPQFKDKQIGRMTESGDGYAGEITDPETDRTYAGTATVNGSSLKLTGCALKIFCRSQTWTKL